MPAASDDRTDAANNDTLSWVLLCKAKRQYLLTHKYADTAFWLCAAVFWDECVAVTHTTYYYRCTSNFEDETRKYLKQGISQMWQSLVFFNLSLYLTNQKYMYVHLLQHSIFYHIADLQSVGSTISIWAYNCQGSVLHLCHWLVAL